MLLELFAKLFTFNLKGGAVNINLTQQPPTIQAITAERQHYKLRIQQIRQTIYAIAIILTIANVVFFAWCWWTVKSGNTVNKFLPVLGSSFIFITMGVLWLATRNDFRAVMAFLAGSIALTIFIGVGWENQLSIPAAWITGTVTFLTFYAASDCISELNNKLNNKLNALDPITPKDCIDIVKWCADPVVDTYRQQVIAQQREIIKAEYEAMKKWVRTADNRAKAKQSESAHKTVYELSQ